MSPPITFVLLSPTYGMHLYTADLARTVTAGLSGARHSEAVGLSGARHLNDPKDRGARHLLDPSVRVVTTTTAPRDVYGDSVGLIAPITTHGTGFSREGLDLPSYRRLLSALAGQPSTFNLV